MKQIFPILTVLIILITAAAPCAAYIDPILLNEPNDAVFGCKNDIFIEFMNSPVITASLGGRRAADNYLFFQIEMLFLVDDTWNGIDKTSFTVRHTGPDGTQEEFPLAYAARMITNLKQNMRILSDKIAFTSLYNYILVFNVTSTDREGWTLLFRPSERGDRDSYCEIEVPLTIR